MWSLPVRQSVKVNGVTYQRPANPYQVENDSIIMSTDANPSPGLSRVRPLLYGLAFEIEASRQIASRSSKHDIAITTRIPGTTVGAAAFFQRTAILHVMTNSIRVLEPGMHQRS
jgi:cleavage and polyadenylation specificity factor subunit 1